MKKLSTKILMLTIVNTVFILLILLGITVVSFNNSQKTLITTYENELNNSYNSLLKMKLIVLSVYLTTIIKKFQLVN